VDLSWPPPPPPRRGFGPGIVLGASILSAVIASVATVAVVGTGPAGLPRPTNGFQSTVATAVPVPTLAALGAGAAPAATSAPVAEASAGGSLAPSPRGSAAATPSAAMPAAVSSAIPSVPPTPSALPSAPPTAIPSGQAAADPNAVIVAVAARVSPAVVTITTDVGGSFSNPFALPATGVGSGFIFDPAGWILTNDHVVEGATSITVTLKGGRQLAGRVAATDPSADLAVVKVDATNLPTVAIGSSANLQVGQLLIAIGSPLGTYSDSVTSGILSATGRTVTVADYQTRQRRRMTNMLQTDAAINPGNSGGPLLDAHGDVIGINSAVDQSAEGIGFAIPIDAAKSIMEQAKKAG
jgi:S1-C subfamily serine protease